MFLKRAGPQLAPTSPPAVIDDLEGRATARWVVLPWVGGSRLLVAPRHWGSAAAPWFNFSLHCAAPKLHTWPPRSALTGRAFAFLSGTPPFAVLQQILYTGLYQQQHALLCMTVFKPLQQAADA